MPSSTDMMQGSQNRRDAKMGRAIHFGFKKLEKFRKNRMLMMNQYVGRMYGRNKPDRRGVPTPLNLIHQAVTTMVPNLVFGDPKMKVSSNFLLYRDYGDLLAMATNHLIEEIDLRTSLRQMILDALFMCGVSKTGLGASDSFMDMGDGYLHDVGQPFCDRVDPDDLTIDPLARDWEEAYFIGNRFRKSIPQLEEEGMYDMDLIRRLHSRYMHSRKDEEVSFLGGTGFDHQAANEIVEYVDLVEAWCPHENAVKVFPWDPSLHGGNEPIRTMEYDGPETGPYDVLGFAFVSDNVMPIAPAGIWLDLHQMANSTARKLAEQAERQKSILAYEATAWEDAADIRDASDGQTVRVDNVAAIKEISYGGSAEDNYKFIEWSTTYFSDMAMSMDLLSGSGTNEPTATQAELVQANTTVRLADMQRLVYDFARKIGKKLAFYLHTDPFINLPLTKRGMDGNDVQVFYTPEQREGDFFDYNFDVEPYSMARTDPNVQVRRKLEFFSNVVPALAQAFQMLGPAFNIEGALRIMGRDMDIKELDELINSPILQLQMQRAMELLQAGVPLDPKVISTLMGPVQQQTESAGPAQVGKLGQLANIGAKIGQPNPMGNMQGGIDPQTEQNQMYQETAGELQSTYGGY